MLPSPEWFDAQHPADRPGAAYRCDCGVWSWAVASWRPLTAAERACPRGRADCPDCARLKIAVDYRGVCPACRRVWTHQSRY